MSAWPEQSSPISDWESELKTPQEEEKDAQDYRRGRNDMINREKTVRSDASFRSSLSFIAHEACAIVSQVRASEDRESGATTVEKLANSFLVCHLLLPENK